MQRPTYIRGESERSSLKFKAGWLALGCFCLAAFSVECHAGDSATAPGAARWMSVEKGVIEDTRTGLQWTAADNGADINWTDAKSWCVSKRFRWRLPTLLELLSLYVAAPDSGSSSVACGQSTCHTYVEFKLTGSWFWSATPVGADAYDGIEMAWGVQLVNGAKTESVMVLSEGSRALCVRNR